MMRVKKSGYHGFWLPDYGVGLDTSSPTIPYTFISHAHADHVPRNHDIHVYATKPTIAFMKLRGFRGSFTELSFLVPFETPKARITLFPAGHILGSAMVFVETTEGNLLYTGDFRNPPSPASEGFSAPENVDFLITEATFGLPIYKWQTHEHIFQEIRDFAVAALESDATPVFLGYNLGKAQEIMYALAPLSERIQIHGAGYPLCQIYVDQGFDLGRYETYNKNSVKGAILVAPSSVLNSSMLQHLGAKKVAYCSGWASHESRRQQMVVDKLIPLSDHIDFFELLALCKQWQPRHIWITHTPNPKVIAHYLTEAGLSVSSLDIALSPEDGL